MTKVLEVSYTLPFIRNEVPLNKVWQEDGEDGGRGGKLLHERLG